MSTSVGINLPQIRAGAPTPPAELADFAAAAEDAGFDALWVSETQMGPAQALDPLPVLTFAAARTERVRLVAGLLVLPVHEPVRLASTLATIDRLGEGRLDVGVAVGAPGVQFSAFGARRRGRGRRFEEQLALMRRLWSDEGPVDAELGAASLSGVLIRPRPAQDPLPVWIGGHSEPALGRAARLGDGWMGSGMSPASAFAASVRRLRELLDEEGRDAGAFPVAKRAYVAIEQRPDGVEAWFRAIYGAPAPGPETLVQGDADAVGEQLLALREAGAAHLMVHPVGDERAQLETVAERILPRLRR